VSKQRFIELSWQLLEHKYRYYVQNTNSISDYEYDMLEKEYDALADQLGLPKSATDMVGFDESRPCAFIIQKKVTPPKSSRRKVKSNE
jgi:NAD-dependent DNA ligase